MYVEDNSGIMPGRASKTAGFHPSDWIYWRTNAALYPTMDKSPVVAHVGTTNRAIFRCPADVSDADRVVQLGPPADSDGLYLSSYSVNTYLVSSFRTMQQTPTNQPFKLSTTKNPSAKLMVVEEPGTFADGDHWSGTPIKKVPNDGHWMANFDSLTVRHGGRAEVAFADGHVEAVKPEFGANENNSLPDF
jgi:prepilin-type processing-associated H-X9-DG protein